MNHTVLHYLEKTVAKFPNKTAIVDENGSLSFSELRNCALSIAGHIMKKLHGQVHLPILVYLPKGKHSIATFMGIAYSGNMYTPTDVKFPFPKVESVLSCLYPALIISDYKHAGKLKDNGISDEKILLYEDIVGGDIEFDLDDALRTMIDTDPVYIFFTSGSTGVPKGVVITHRSIIDYIEWATECFSIDETHCLGNQAPLYFDNSILDLYLCIKTGAQLYIIPESHFLFPVKLMQYIEENNINFIFWVPSALCHVANQDVLSIVKVNCIKKVLFCGEVMPNKQLNYWRKHLPNALYANLYGPTEITDACAYYIVDKHFEDSDPLPIGRPCANTDIILLDEQNRRITDPNKQGELCVRGTSLSVGYWDSLEKTNERLIQNPLNPHYPEKIYLTGDLAHYNESGELMFDGRKDFQIKHLGHRIELGEIENAAFSMQGVDSVCADYDTEKQRIVMFFEGEAQVQELQRHLLKTLPKYMVPTEFIKYDALPINDNGKIDRKTLHSAYIGR